MQTYPNADQEQLHALYGKGARMLGLMGYVPGQALGKRDDKDAVTSCLKASREFSISQRGIGFSKKDEDKTTAIADNYRITPPTCITCKAERWPACKSRKGKWHCGPCAQPRGGRPRCMGCGILTWDGFNAPGRVKWEWRCAACYEEDFFGGPAWRGWFEKRRAAYAEAFLDGGASFLPKPGGKDRSLVIDSSSDEDGMHEQVPQASAPSASALGPKQRKRRPDESLVLDSSSDDDGMVLRASAASSSASVLGPSRRAFSRGSSPSSEVDCEVLEPSLHLAQVVAVQDAPGKKKKKRKKKSGKWSVVPSSGFEEAPAPASKRLLPVEFQTSSAKRRCLSPPQDAPGNEFSTHADRMVGKWLVTYRNNGKFNYQVFSDFQIKTGKKTVKQLLATDRVEYPDAFLLRDAHRRGTWEYLWIDEDTDTLVVHHFCLAGTDISPNGVGHFWGLGRGIRVK